ncbi:hypothetical protein EGW08_007118 [Elysia chlorotica]|uniref:Uncharacterized protein n=1 Tax=Elysia chlorotica TaxID=188477 RepID=A0A433TU77_ELYCH|nr:hypothetical protein EGW08_007118 [Elysia chlorotica]
MAKPSVILLVSSLDHQLDQVMSIFTSVVNKFPDAKVVLTITSDGGETASDYTGKVNKMKEILSAGFRDWLAQRKAALKQRIEEIRGTVTTIISSQLPAQRKSQPDEQALVPALTKHVKNVLTSSLSVDEDVLTTNTSTNEGVPELRQKIVQLVTRETAATENPMLPSPVSKHFVYGVILEMTEAGIVLLPRKEFSEVLRNKLSLQYSKQWKEAFLEEVIRYLIYTGHILEFPALTSPTDADWSREKSIAKKETSPANKTETGSLPAQNGHAQSFVCVDPETFANMISACIIEDNKTTFRLEAGRFWPPESGFQPPEPSSLARVLEDIPGHGVIREAVLPLLWQDFGLSESQIQHCVSLLQHLGVFADHPTAHSDIAGLAMPDYLALSAVQCYTLVLMNLLPNTKPVNMCTEISTTGLDITARVNGDEPGMEEEAVSKLWAHLVPAVLVLQDFLHQELPGYTSISLHGDVFFNMASTNQDVELSLERCILSWQACGGHMTVPYRDETRQLDLELLFPFKGDEAKNVWTPVEFLSLVMKKRMASLGGQIQTNVQKPTDQHQHPPERSATLTRTRSKRQTPKKKVVSVTWKTNIAEDLEMKSLVPDHKGTTVKPSEAPPVSTTNASSSTTTPSSTTTTTTAIDSAVAAVTQVVTHSGLSPEDMMREKRQLAARFVSAMMAAGVVKYISNACTKDADGGAGVLTEAQISVAEATAQAAMAVHSGHLEGAASAVIDALQAAHASGGWNKSAHASGGWNKSRGSKSSQGKSSKTCSVF